MAVCLVAGTLVRAAPQELQFNRDVRPILSDKCYACHGPDPDARQADLRLDTLEGATADLGDHAAIVPGKPEASEVMVRITTSDADLAMPPTKHPKKLTAQEKDVLRRWIAAGAKYEQHWSFVKPVKATPPSVSNTAWPRNDIDRFVLARLEKEGLQPSPEAEPAVLLRRLYLDLIGLPPTPAEVDAYVQSAIRNPQSAIENTIDSLLSRPEFGERWARPWLDLARYADSHGFQRDDLRDVWAYRDWVIDAFNRDLPFDQFTIEQLAGDLLPDATREQKVATGFHRCTPTNVEAGSEPEETRINQVIDRVNTTGAVWLGVTLECAQCHTHKFDPFTQREYYQLLAFYNNTEQEADRSNPKTPGSIRFLGPSMVLDETAGADQRAQVQQQLKTLDKEIKQVEERLSASQAEWEQEAREKLSKDAEEADDGTPEAATVRVARFLKVAPEKRNPRQKLEVQNYYFAQADELKPLRQRRAGLQKKLEGLKPPSTLVMRELDAPRPTAMFNRGVYTDRGDSVTAGVPAVLHPLTVEPPNRLTLARWLVDRNNPLTARVTVNRWWAELFGRGIVSTVEDFGTKGEAPTHPELLDWLAVDFMEQGWSLKKLLKQIVMSATYRQSSRMTPELLARDDQNRLLARGPRFRLDAEAIRDNALSIAGLLSLKKGGLPIRPPQPDGLWTKVGGEKYNYVVSPGEDKYRRGIYVVLKRGAPYPSFVTFDASARMACVVRRSRSNTPLQALTLLNDPVYVEAAQALARRIVADRPETKLDERLKYAFQLCVSRSPSERELKLLRGLCDGELASGRDKQAAWQAIATALLNLDETITKT